MLAYAHSALVALAVASLASAANHSVVVGGPGGTIAFTPNQVTAEVGDLIVFQFQQKNHSVTQSSLQNPCSPLDGGFNSGFIPVADDATDFPIRGLEIRNTDPYWVYCAQGTHCQQGMVFAVNGGANFDAFVAAATGGSTASATSTAPPTSAATGVVTVTATVTVGNGGQVITTTYGSYPGSAQPTAAAPQQHTVIVGGPNNLTFQPANISAQVGDVISFQFRQKNHTATQSSFGQPCKPLAQTSSSGQVGFNSGFNPVSADTTSDFPTFNVTVNDTAPIWVYCAQTAHCGQGMVFSANAVESGPNNFEAFRQLAITQNGTAAGGNGGNTTTPSGNGAASLSVTRGAGLSVAVVAAVFGFIL